jgi:DNA-binding NtrC family response regulator
LRERREDIPHLVAHFVRKYAAEFGKSITGIDYASLQALQHAEWQGNIRELENIIERSMIISSGNVLHIAIDNTQYILQKNTPQASNDEPLGKATSKDVHSPTAAAMQSHTEAERAHIMRVLQETNWRVSGERGAAAILKMKPTTLEYRMKKLGIQRER